MRPGLVLVLDLGLHRDRSALAIVETGPPLKLLDAANFPLGTPYRHIPDLIRRILDRYAPDASATLSLDASGVGTAVLDLFRLAGLPLDIAPITITTGACSRRTARGHNVSRARLLRHALSQVVSGALDCPAPAVLQKRVEDALRPTSTPDDLVFALALALWIAAPHLPRDLPNSLSLRFQT